MRQAPRRHGRAAHKARAETEDIRNAALTIRVDFGAFGYLGPGKIMLMELISKHGSISAAGLRLQLWANPADRRPSSYSTL